MYKTFVYLLLPFFSLSESTFAKDTAILRFIDPVQTFDSVPYGPTLGITYTFVNDGKAPLYLKNVRPSCGCVTAIWSRDSLLQGDTGYVNAKYMTRGRPGSFTKSITVESNGGRAVLYLKGFVKPQKMKTTTWKFFVDKVNLDTVEYGKTITATFQFVNTGTEELSITGVQPSWGYGHAEWPKQPIPPKQNGTVTVRYNTAGKVGKTVRTIYVYSNAGTQFLWLTCFIETKSD